MEFISDVSGVTLGEYLKKYHGFSRRIISRLKFENGILVNGNPEFTNFMLRENDVITVIFSEKKSENTIPQQIPRQGYERSCSDFQKSACRKASV